MVEPSQEDYQLVFSSSLMTPGNMLLSIRTETTDPQMAFPGQKDLYLFEKHFSHQLQCFPCSFFCMRVYPAPSTWFLPLPLNVISVLLLISLINQHRKRNRKKQLLTPLSLLTPFGLYLTLGPVLPRALTLEPYPSRTCKCTDDTVHNIFVIC